MRILYKTYAVLWLVLMVTIRDKLLGSLISDATPTPPSFLQLSLCISVISVHILGYILLAHHPVLSMGRLD